ncbi:MAG: DUF5683 domain-containing protein [candidate division Zixibacteria bacterium]
MNRTLLIIILAVGFYSGGICQNADSTVVRKISPGGALLRSAFVPGWGQFYNRKYIKAGIFSIGQNWLAYGIYNNWKDADKYERNFKSATDDPEYQADQFAKYENARDSRNFKMWIMAAAIFYSMFDAYVDAQLADFNQSDRSFEVYIGPGKNDEITVGLTFNIP